MVDLSNESLKIVLSKSLFLMISELKKQQTFQVTTV